MRSSWDSSPSSSSEDNYSDDLTPTQLLSMAIKKRRSVYESKDRDYRRELLHTGMIQSLCKFLGEGRASRRSNRRKRSRSSTNSQKKSTELPKKYAISNETLEAANHDGGVKRVEKEPTMLEINGSGMEDEDAVVPVVKRPKYEQEYVMEDFLNGLVSFYTPNEYYTSTDVEPTKDLYWWNDPADELEDSIPPDFHRLAFCSY